MEDKLLSFMDMMIKEINARLDATVEELKENGSLHARVDGKCDALRRLLSLLKIMRSNHVNEGVRSYEIGTLVAFNPADTKKPLDNVGTGHYEGIDLTLLHIRSEDQLELPVGKIVRKIAYSETLVHTGEPVEMINYIVESDRDLAPPDMSPIKIILYPIDRNGMERQTLKIPFGSRIIDVIVREGCLKLALIAPVPRNEEDPAPLVERKISVKALGYSFFAEDGWPDNYIGNATIRDTTYFVFEVTNN